MNQRWIGVVRLCFALLLCSLLPSAGVQAQQKSLLIRGGTVIDGSGGKARRADVRLSGEKIVEIGRLKQNPGEEVIEAAGLVVAPGFIDIHNHSEEGLVSDPRAQSQILQGITTLAIGPDGGSPWPVGNYLDWFDKRRQAPNILSFIGHATVRRQVMRDDFKRPATPAEITAMEKLVDEAMREGAFGLSSGLEYDVGNPATTDEVIALSRIAAKYRGIYMSHVRDEADAAMDAFREAIRIGREAGIPVQISHIKLGTVGVWGRAGEASRLIADARRKGTDITADCYPYDAWASTITVLVPSRRHDDPVAVRKGLDDVGGGDNVTVSGCRAHPEFEGKTLTRIGADLGLSPVDVYIRIVRDGGASVICRSMTEPDIRTFYRQPWVMVSSDGGISGRHPRGAGTFPRVLGLYVREKRWLSLEEAVRKMSALPAQRLGITDRGRIAKGLMADLTIFDPRTIIDRATMLEPRLEPAGMVHVLVNGRFVVRDGRVTGETPGVTIRR